MRLPIAEKYFLDLLGDKYFNQLIHDGEKWDDFLQTREDEATAFTFICVKGFYASYGKERETVYVDEDLCQSIKDMSISNDNLSKILKSFDREYHPIVFELPYNYVLFIMMMKERAHLSLIRNNHFHSIASIEYGERSGIKFLRDVDEGRDRDEGAYFVAFIAKLIAYYIGNKDVVDYVGHKYNYKKKEKRLLKNVKTKPKSKIMGYQLGRSIRWYAEINGDPDSPEPGSPRKPHVRRPHPHLYWTGSGRNKPVIKFLGPISVGGADIPDHFEPKPIISRMS